MACGVQVRSATTSSVEATVEGRAGGRGEILRAALAPPRPARSRLSAVWAEARISDADVRRGHG